MFRLIAASKSTAVIPAKAGIRGGWMPAFEGMTMEDYGSLAPKPSGAEYLRFGTVASGARPAFSLHLQGRAPARTARRHGAEAAMVRARR